MVGDMNALGLDDQFDGSVKGAVRDIMRPETSGTSGAGQAEEKKPTQSAVRNVAIQCVCRRSYLVVDGAGFV